MNNHRREHSFVHLGKSEKLNIEQTWSDVDQYGVLAVLNTFYQTKENHNIDFKIKINVFSRGEGIVSIWNGHQLNFSNFVQNFENDQTKINKIEYSV